MVFIILNAAIGASLIAFSFSVDSIRKNTYEGNALTNMTLFLSAIFIITEKQEVNAEPGRYPE